MIVVDAVTRLLPGALGDATSALDESFSHGLLEYPQYTRPADFRGMTVPDVLLSGHHAAIETWRVEQARRRTRQRRPDLLDNLQNNPKSGLNNDLTKSDGPDKPAAPNQDPENG
jgi:tRNA (guanine37-N1)-methyltransferase